MGLFVAGTFLLQLSFEKLITMTRISYSFNKTKNGLFWRLLQVHKMLITINLRVFNPLTGCFNHLILRLDLDHIKVKSRKMIPAAQGAAYWQNFVTLENRMHTLEIYIWNMVRRQGN